MKTQFLKYVYLFFLFTLLLYVSAGSFFGRELSHDFPFGYMASDAFQHQVRVQGIKELGHYRTQPFYAAAGYDDVAGFYPPLFFHLVVLFSNASGLETYDAAFVFVFFLVIASAFVLYAVIERFNSSVAVLASSMSVLLFSRELLVPLAFGHWPALAGSFFIIAVIWALPNLELKRSWLLLALFFGGVALAHTSEALLVAAAIVVWLAAEYAFERKAHDIVPVIKAGLLAFALSLYFLIVFALVWLPAEQKKLFSVFRPESWGTPFFGFSSFSWLWILIALGAVAALPKIRNKNVRSIAVLSAALFLLGFGNWLGMDFRALQLRFFWPLYLAFFFGLGVFALMRFLPAKGVLSIVFAVVLALLFVKFFVLSFSSPGIMTRQHWDSFMWLKANTPENATVLFFYGDGYDQNSILRNSHRVYYQLTANTIIGILSNGSLTRYPAVKLSADDGTLLPYRKGGFSFGFHVADDAERFRELPRDICGYDYYVVDTNSQLAQMAPLVQFNLIMRNIFINRTMTEVFSNGAVSILRNNDKGGACVPA